MQRHQMSFTVISLLAIASVCFAQDNKQTKARADHSQKSKLINHKIVGTWRLVSDEFRRPNGEVIPFPGLGPNVRGLLVYDATGNMAVHIMNVDRPNLAGARTLSCGFEWRG